MPSPKLTARGVEHVKPPKRGRVEYWDAALPGFGLRVTHTGSRSWVAMFRAGGRLRRMTLGTFPALQLADARDKAREVLRSAQKGNDPAAKKIEERRREADLFHNIAAAFVERHCKPNNRGWDRQQADLQREFVSHWRNRPIGSITRRDILEVIDALADRTSPQRANRYLALIKKLFSWALDRDLIEANPAAGVKPPGKALSRDRALSSEEIALFWHCCGEAGWPFGHLFRLLLVTAQRLGEVSAARWSDVDLERGVWTIPAEAAKNGRANEVPLSALALGLFRAAQAFRRNDLVFSALNGSGNPVSGFSKAKDRLDAAMATRRADIQPWRLHDLRRTAATGMAELGIAPHVIERCLNHVSGTISGVAAVYNRHGYVPEKRQALDAWAARIEELIRPALAVAAS